MCLYYEYVVFDFEFSRFVFDFELFGGKKKKKNPEIFFFLKKTYSCVSKTQL